MPITIKMDINEELKFHDLPLANKQKLSCENLGNKPCSLAL